MAQDEKLKALDAALAQIEKQFGKGSVMKLGDKGAALNIETVSTGALSLDIALGLGGVPKGRIVEIYGPESSGKTTVALHMVAEVQKRGGIAGFIDAEHALDPVYAKNIGVDIDNLYISQPDNGEQALEITETMVRSGAVDIIIVDYLQLMNSPKRIDNRVQEISEITRSLKLMAKDLNIPVVAMAQLSRANTQRADKTPMLSDLRDSGSIEQDADIVLLFHRENYYQTGMDVPDENADQNECQIIVAKNRHGETKTILTHWQGEFMRFTAREVIRHE